MNTLGFYMSLPWSFIVYVFVVTAVFMIISMVWWSAMKHFPEDEQNWSDENRYVYKEDDD